MIKKIFCTLLVAYSFGFAQYNGAKIEAKQSEYNFGDIKVGETVSFDFLISNVGSDTLTIKRIATSSGCSVSKLSKDFLLPFESTKLHVIFDSKNEEGKQEKFITVFSNDKNNPAFNLKLFGTVIEENLTGNAKPRIYFPETEHSFGQVTHGDILNYVFKFSNTGTAPLKIKNIHTSCGCTAALLSSKILQPGQEGSIRVQLDTSKRMGQYYRTITIDSNDPDQPQKILKLYVDVRMK